MLYMGFYFLPKKVFFGWYILLASTFALLFAFTFTCLVRSIKDQIILHKKNKKPVLSALASLIGLSAFQVCGIGAPICGISIGAAVVSSIFPSFAFNIINDYALYIIYISIALQIFSLVQMKCFTQIINSQDCTHTINNKDCN